MSSHRGSGHWDADCDAEWSCTTMDCTGGREERSSLVSVVWLVTRHIVTRLFLTVTLSHCQTSDEWHNHESYFTSSPGVRLLPAGPDQCRSVSRYFLLQISYHFQNTVRFRVVQSTISTIASSRFSRLRSFVVLLLISERLLCAPILTIIYISMIWSWSSAWLLASFFFCGDLKGISGDIHLVSWQCSSEFQLFSSLYDDQVGSVVLATWEEWLAVNNMSPALYGESLLASPGTRWGTSSDLKNPVQQ